MGQDIRAYMIFAAGSIALFLFVLFRRFSGVVFPLLVVTAALVGNLGTMVWLGIPFSMSLGMLPIFTMCVGICNAVHVLVLVYRSLGRGDSREEAIAYAFGHSGLAMLLTCLTTAAGMLSFLTAELQPIQHLGMTAPFGVLYAYLFTMTLLPALIGVMPPRRKLGAQKTGFGWAETLLIRTGDFATGHPVSTLAVGGAVLLVAIVGATQLRFVHDPVSWFGEGEPLVRGFEILDENLGGAMTTEVRIDTGRENGLHEPDVLRRIDAAMRAAEDIEHGPIHVGKAISVVDIVKETHQALNANDPAFFAVPDTRVLAAQEMLLFENSGSEDLESVTDSRFSIARLTLRVPMVDGLAYRAFAEKVDAALTPILGDDMSLIVTGQTVIQARTFTALIESMVRSYAVALLVITPLMILLIGDLRLGLVSMVPNLFPVVMTLGLMGLVGIDLDASNVVIGSVIIGLAVDDTIHFLHRFRREFELSGNSRVAVRETMATTGSALFFTSLVLATGFVVMGSLGSLMNTVHFGMLSAFGITVAFLSDALLTPALVCLVARSSTRRQEELRVSGAGEISAVSSPMSNG
jgi:predicted RND superfamily exporter protein